MTMKKGWMQGFGIPVGMVFLLMWGWSAAYASCITSICRERGYGYDCHAVDEAPEWVCRRPKSMDNASSGSGSFSNPVQSPPPVPRPAPVTVPVPPPAPVQPSVPAQVTPDPASVSPPAPVAAPAPVPSPASIPPPPPVPTPTTVPAPTPVPSPTPAPTQ
jgi:hypothetical protein